MACNIGGDACRHGRLASAWLLSGINDTLHAPDRLNLVLALKLAGLGHAHKVRLEQGRFSTTDLSTGQRRRLALVQALAEHRPVLMLDEWAADQDRFSAVFSTLKSCLN
ncbi:ATP-binding cassette domain-containing protein [Gluconacetobacter entanii]|uniref:ATP-binding cassette domain-containing protein n=1 Tax=Gluconacetobacter entanii TaxID=108528 RepID=UPI00244B4E69|nr:ATP-binding cassette domain-containing protein [Gluconacetobacter entanii]